MTLDPIPADCTTNSGRWQSARTPVLLFCLTILYFWRQLFLGQTLYWGDIGLYFNPMLHFLQQNLRQGRLPLWNPHIMCGAPFMGNPQSWPLYPSSLLLFPFPTGYAINVMIALHVWLAGVGMFLFLRRALSRGEAASLLGAIVFMFGGQLVSKEQFPNMVQAAAYAPWILLAVHRLCSRPSAASAVLLGCVLGLQVLAAHQQMVLLTAYTGTIFGGTLLWKNRKRRQTALALGWATGGVAIAVVLSMGQLLPILEFFTHILRQKYTFAIVNRFYLPPNQLLNFVLPYLHGSPYTGDFTARGNFWETCCYIGWLPFALAIAGLVVSWGRGPAFHSTRIWTVIFILGVWLATGGKGHLYIYAFRWLPGFKNFHDPARCLLLSCLALSALAAAGLDWTAGKIASWNQRTLREPATGQRACRTFAMTVLAVSFLDLAWFGNTIYPLSDAPIERQAAQSPITARVAADQLVAQRQARSLAPDSARVWQRFTSHRSYRRDVPDYGVRWYDTLTPNLGMNAGVDDAYGYDPITDAGAQVVLGGVTSTFAPTASPQARAVAASWAGACGVRYIVTDRIVPPQSVIKGLTPLADAGTLPFAQSPAISGRTYLSRNNMWQPRARLTTDVTWFGDERTAARRMIRTLSTDAPLDLRKTTMISGDGVSLYEAALALAPVSQTPGDPATVVDDGPDHVIVQTDGAKPAMLVLADSLQPGWTCALDGRQVKIFRADGFLRAIVVPAGAHRADFRYRPASFLLGLYLSLAGFSGVVAFCIVRFRRPQPSTARLSGAK